MQSNRFFIAIIFLACFVASLVMHPAYTTPRKPRLVVVFVVDQLAYHYIPKLRPYFRYGLKELFDQGVVYTNAFQAHAIPETTPGHCALSTGTLPKDHGAILNQWFDRSYHKVDFDAEVIKPIVSNGAASSDHTTIEPKTMVDGISDQFVMASKAHEHNYAFAMALKSHPAIAVANQLGKALWFDVKLGKFVSSSVFFEKLPGWVNEFNHYHQTERLTETTWRLAYGYDNEAYNFNDIRNYDYAGYPFSMVTQKKIPINHQEESPYDLFTKTPEASNLLIQLAKACIQNTFQEPTDRLLLWVSLSNLDLVCHYYGPHAIEPIDTVYHLDRQIHDLMGFARRRLGERNCLFVLTADHGIAPIPEIVNKQGLVMAKRIMAEPLIDAMNALIEKNYNLKHVVKTFEPTFFVLNHEILATVTQEIQQKIVMDLKNFLLHQTGIKHVWAADELQNAIFEPDQLENFYKNQMYHNRLGDIICMPHPYCLLTHYPTGTSHLSPYDYDTHIPLVLYQKKRFAKKTVNDKVWAGQLPVTLARILDINQPSASTYPLLPSLDTAL